MYMSGIGGNFSSEAWLGAADTNSKLPLISECSLPGPWQGPRGFESQKIAQLPAGSSIGMKMIWDSSDESHIPKYRTRSEMTVNAQYAYPKWHATSTGSSHRRGHGQGALPLMLLRYGHYIMERKSLGIQSHGIHKAAGVARVAPKKLIKFF